MSKLEEEPVCFLAAGTEQRADNTQSSQQSVNVQWLCSALGRHIPTNFQPSSITLRLELSRNRVFQCLSRHLASCEVSDENW